MPWKAVTAVSQRVEFIQLASAAGADVSELCRRYGISRKTGYKWLRRYRESGAEGLGDQSRRPRRSPAQTRPEVEAEVVALREQRPAWGGRKLRARLIAEREARGLSEADIPAASTITEILRRRGLLAGPRVGQSREYVRFEQAAPNDLWQMDFKGHFALTRGGRCHPLTLLDDHSRFSLALRACGNEQRETVQGHLEEVFRLYGLPRRMLMDHGSPWGDAEGQPYTGLTVWLIRLGIGVTHGAAGHPQTQGKEERFHRTLNVELLVRRSFADLADCQRAFDPWRDVYNLERPHEALGLAVPASRYQVSGRAYPERLPAVEYESGVQVRRASGKGTVSFHHRRLHVGRAFRGEAIGFAATAEDGVWEVRYCHQTIGSLDLKALAPGTEAGLATWRREKA